jgi:hypothetical protein
MKSEKIYIQLLDGVITWVPVEAKCVGGNQFIINEDKEYTDYKDALYLFEFFPGDKVEVEYFSLPDEKVEKVAKNLLEAGSWSERKFNEFKFKAALNQLPIEEQSAFKYRNEIARVKNEQAGGQFFYPTLIETVNKLSYFL